MSRLSESILTPADLTREVPVAGEAHRIESDEEALEVARRVAQRIAVGSAERDRVRSLPYEEIELFSQSGLWAITIPREYGGAGVSTVTLASFVSVPRPAAQ